jgi:cbb3-type cytochrome oxidase maturation protein
MEVLIYLVPLALALGLLGLVAFLWALNSGQFDDLDGAAWRAIMDDDMPTQAPSAQDEKAPEASPEHQGRTS